MTSFEAEKRRPGKQDGRWTLLLHISKVWHEAKRKASPSTFTKLTEATYQTRRLKTLYSFKTWFPFPLQDLRFLFSSFRFLFASHERRWEIERRFAARNAGRSSESARPFFSSPWGPFFGQRTVRGGKEKKGRCWGLDRARTNHLSTTSTAFFPQEGQQSVSQPASKAADQGCSEIIKSRKGRRRTGGSKIETEKG